MHLHEWERRRSSLHLLDGGLWVFCHDDAVCFVRDVTQPNYPRQGKRGSQKSLCQVQREAHLRKSLRVGVPGKIGGRSVTFCCYFLSLLNVYLHWVHWLSFAETLRKYPPVPMLTRICMKSYKIPGTDVVIEKGIPIVISISGLHMDPKYYPDPEKFEPDRFTEEEKRKRHRYAYLPFGEGLHQCLGGYLWPTNNTFNFLNMTLAHPSTSHYNIFGIIRGVVRLLRNLLSTHLHFVHLFISQLSVRMPTTPSISTCNRFPPFTSSKGVPLFFSSDNSEERFHLPPRRHEFFSFQPKSFIPFDLNRNRRIQQMIK